MLPTFGRGLPVIARGVSKSGHCPDGPDFGEARPAWGAVPECNTGNPATTGKGTGTNAPSLRSCASRGEAALYEEGASYGD